MAYPGKNIILIASATVVVVALVLLFSARRVADDWVVFVNAIPGNISAKGAVDMESSYIIRQTHEPLFRQDDGQNFQTRLLKSWSRSPDYREYTFCPDTGLVFFGDQKLSADYFDAYISSVTKRYSTVFNQVRAGACVRINFSKPAMEYLHFLANYENAPSVQMLERAETGLGPFAIAEMTDKEIRLERKKRITNGYNSVVLRLYKTGDDISGKEPVSDFNKVLFNKNWKTGEYFAFDNVEPRAIVLLINHHDRRVRRAIYDCMDIDGFNKAYVPSLGSFNYIGTVIPMGMVGAQWGRPLQNCQADIGVGAGQEIEFANYQPGNDEALKKFLDGFSRSTGLTLKVKRYSSKELIDLIKERRKRQPYQLIVFMLDSTRNEYADILDYFYGENTVIADMPATAKKSYQALLREEDQRKKEALAKKLSAFLSEEYFALPLFQYSKTMYYPKNIKNITVGRGFIEYPEVADFKW